MPDPPPPLVCVDEQVGLSNMVVNSGNRFSCDEVKWPGVQVFLHNTETSLSLKWLNKDIKISGKNLDVA